MFSLFDRGEDRVIRKFLRFNVLDINFGCRVSGLL